MRSSVTIGQAAAFAGVTVKTVRHYHKLGLVDEPERDSSGYRRYRSPELVRLVQVRTLAGAGVPLAEIGPLLDADDAEFTAALAGVEQQLSAQIDELVARRETLRKLADGNRALLPDRAMALLDRMPGLGFSADEIGAAREGLVLARALVPEGFDEHLANVELALQDAAFVAVSRRAAEVATWDPDDPRIEHVAAEMAEQYLASPDQLKIVTGMQARTDSAARYGLVRDVAAEDGTAAGRLAALVESRLRAAGIRIPRPDAG